MIRKLTASLLVLLCLVLHAQEEYKGVCHDSLILQVSKNGSHYLQWRVGRNTSLSKISEATGRTIEGLVSINPILRFRDLESCDQILVPFDIGSLDRSFHHQGYPVYYRVRSGETVYGIAKRMLQMPVDSLLKMNGLQSINVYPGQLLHIGSIQTHNPGPLMSEQVTGQPWLHHPGYEIDSALVNPSRDKHYVSQKGVAWWNKAKPDPNLFVLHRLAAVNSLIEIRNPMFGRSVWAKVIGTIPPTYADDIALIVSQGVARYLGAIDGRFHVEVRYEVK